MANLFRWPGTPIEAALDQVVAIRATNGKFYNVTIEDLLSLSVDGALIPSITDDGTDVTIDANLAVTGTFTVGGDTIPDIINLPSITDDGNEVSVDADLDVVGTLKLDSTAVGSTAPEIDNVADVSARVQELTASGAVTTGKQSVELNHATVAVAATIADAVNHQGLFIVKDTSASGTAGHSLKLTAGTFDGTNNTVTFNAPNDALAVYFDSNGSGTILVNVGSAALSST
jgi:hypothetical protein